MKFFDLNILLYILIALLIKLTFCFINLLFYSSIINQLDINKGKKGKMAVLGALSAY